MDVAIRKLPPLRVAYISRFGAYGPEIGACFEKLMIWAHQNFTIDSANLQLSAYWHDPQTTAPEDCRSDACICLPEDFNPAPNPHIKVQTLPAQLYAMGLCNIFNDDFGQAWIDMFETELPKLSYVMDTGPCLEIFYNCALLNPVNKWVVDICIPVREINHPPFS